ncbi:Alpha/Beta hydrolase protein [Exophiala viscosa]|uniref:Alpha/Beta hydrolase protein n=1 Tax=Exophiala viscosa TaxID=2486360 RepID=A0AAN6IBZ8_9EURO|nr:Alpha/Beta hydrolase protein [Exophiala viscosa]
MRLSLVLASALAGTISTSLVEAANATQKAALASLPLALSPDPEFNFQLLISLGSLPYAAGDILAAAAVLVQNSFYSFNTTFAVLANATYAAAEKAAVPNPVNARNTYFAASNYYRSADFFLHGNWSDPLIFEYWTGQTLAFNKAIASLPVPGRRITLPADGFETVGTYFAVDNSTTKRRTLVIIQGYDAAQEDSYMQMGASAIQRGWNVLTIEGPGQPTVRRYQGLGFIPDYEKVLVPAVNWLANRTDIDMSKLALAGISMGGYLAARAAAYEPRIKALVLDDGVWDVQASIESGFPTELLQIYAAGNQTEFDAIIDDAIVNNASASSSARWGIDQGLWAFKTHSTYNLLQQAAAYKVQNITHLLNIPILVGNAVDDTDFPGQAMEVYHQLVSQNKNVTLHNFTGPASYHCQAGDFETANRAMLGWLETAF